MPTAVAQDVRPAVTDIAPGDAVAKLDLRAAAANSNDVQPPLAGNAVDDDCVLVMEPDQPKKLHSKADLRTLIQYLSLLQTRRFEGVKINIKRVF